MLEAELGLWPAARGPQQVEALQLVQRLVETVSLCIQDRLEQRAAEPTSERGSGCEQVVAGWRQAVDAREHDALHRRRYLHRHLVVEAPAPVLAHDRAGVDERADELLEVEGVPLRSGEHALLELGGQHAGADHRLEQRALRAAWERLERHLRQQVGNLARRELADRPGGMVAVVALHHHEQHGGALSDGEQTARRAAPTSHPPSGGRRSGSSADRRRRGARGAPPRPRTSGTAAPPERGRRAAPPPPARARFRGASRGRDRSRARGRRRAPRRRVAGSRGRVAPGRRARLRATRGGGRGRASTGGTRRRRRTCPRATSPRTPRVPRGSSGSSRSRLRP
jgi:hypothetical protein